MKAKKMSVELHDRISTTERGFGDYADFLDTYRSQVRVRESSADPLDKVWVFVRKYGEQDSAGAHLNVEMARKLATALLSWVAKQEEGK